MCPVFPQIANTSINGHGEQQTQKQYKEAHIISQAPKSKLCIFLGSHIHYRLSLSLSFRTLNLSPQSAE